MIIETASHYSTINSTAFVVQFVPLHVNKPILHILLKGEDDPIPTNVAALTEMINDASPGVEHHFEGAKEIRDNTFDTVEDFNI